MSKQAPSHQIIVMGCHTLEAIVEHSPERIIKIFYLSTSAKSQPRKRKLLESLQRLKKTMQIVNKNDLDRICGSTSHQGIAAVLKQREMANIEAFIKTNQSKLVVVLDSIYDPHNVGAILRACECFGVGLVIWSKNRGAPLSPVVTKTSSSASEFVPLSLVSNLSTELDKFIHAGYTLIGAQVTPVSHNLFEYRFPKLAVLILGSEGEGIRDLLQRKIKESVAIPMQGKIDSLNVSQAAAVCIGQWYSQDVSSSN